LETYILNIPDLHFVAFRVGSGRPWSLHFVAFLSDSELLARMFKIRAKAMKHRSQIFKSAQKATKCNRKDVYDAAIAVNLRQLTGTC
jgi:hypothetical protein